MTAAVERRRLARRQLLALLTSMPGDGITHYSAPGAPPPPPPLAPEADPDLFHDAAAASETGSVLFAGHAQVTLVLPPFPVEETLRRDRLDPQPLIALVERPRTVAVILLRLGGFSVGVFRSHELIASKTDQRFVKNRHRKGGQSQRRFERIREKQIQELLDKACETVRAVLDPHDAEIERIFLGGDRQALIALRKRCPRIDRYGARLSARILPVAGEVRRATLERAPHDVWSSEVLLAPAAAP